MTTKSHPIETETEATHGAHLLHSLFAPAYELMDQLQSYQDCQAGEHPGYEDVLLTREHSRDTRYAPASVAYLDAIHRTCSDQRSQ